MAALSLLGVALGALVLVTLYFAEGPTEDSTERGLYVARTRPLTTAAGLEDQPSLSPDGTRVAYASDQLGQMDIWVQPLETSPALALTPEHPGYDGSPAWSPDGNWIAFASERNGGGIDVVSALGGPARRVASLPFAPSPELPGSIPGLCWSPDGSRIAVAHGVEARGGLLIVPADGGRLEEIPLPAEMRAFALVDPVWSPDGARLAVAAVSGTARTTSRIWSVAVDGSDAVPITDGNSLDRTPVWIADPPSVFFVSDRGGSSDVWSLSVDPHGRPGGGARRVTTGAGAGSIAILDGARQLVYSKVVERANIWALPASETLPLAWRDAAPLRAENQRVEWVDVSRDGEWIAFDSDRGGDVDLWLMRPDGSDLRRVTGSGHHEWHPSFSPDGTRLAYHSLRGDNRDVFVIAVDGGDETQLTHDPERDWLPAWSPDGDWIAFCSDRSGSQDVYLVSSSGGESRALVSHPANDHNPTWSPDGSRVAFASDRGGSHELYTADVEGGDPVAITDQGWDDLVPLLWRSQLIYAWARKAGEPSGFVAVDVKDGSARPLLGGPGRRRAVPPALASDGEAVFFPVSDRVADLWLADLVPAVRGEP